MAHQAESVPPAACVIALSGVRDSARVLCRVVLIRHFMNVNSNMGRKEERKRRTLLAGDPDPRARKTGVAFLRVL